MDAWLFVRACLGVVGITLAVSMTDARVWLEGPPSSRLSRT